MAIRLAGASRSGRMAVSMKAIGYIILLMEREDLYIRMGMLILATGLMIGHMDKVNMFILMVLYIMENGKKTNKMVTGKSVGQMVLNTEGNM